jgi:DNA-directed RNA polymerase subunit RPC12/RpoP
MIDDSWHENKCTRCAKVVEGSRTAHKYDKYHKCLDCNYLVRNGNYTAHWFTDGDSGWKCKYCGVELELDTSCEYSNLPINQDTHLMIQEINIFLLETQ